MTEKEWSEKNRQFSEALFDLSPPLCFEYLEVIQGLMSLISFANKKVESYDTINVSHDQGGNE